MNMNVSHLWVWHNGMMYTNSCSALFPIPCSQACLLSWLIISIEVSPRRTGCHLQKMSDKANLWGHPLPLHWPLCCQYHKQQPCTQRKWCTSKYLFWCCSLSQIRDSCQYLEGLTVLGRTKIGILWSRRKKDTDFSQHKVKYK